MLKRIKRRLKYKLFRLIIKVKKNILPYTILFGVVNALFFMFKTSIIFFYKLIMYEDVVMTPGHWITLVIFIVSSYYLIKYAINIVRQIRNKERVDGVADIDI